MINCANTSTPEYKALKSRVGTDVAYYIWHVTQGQINEYGIPKNGSSTNLDARAIDLINESRQQEYSDKKAIEAASDKTIRRDLFNNQNSITVSEVLDNILSRSPGRYDFLIRALKSTLSKNALALEIKLIPSAASPYYDSRSGRFSASVGIYKFNNGNDFIEINEFAKFSRSKDGKADNTVVHEIIHAVTMNFVSNNPNSPEVKALDKILKKARKALAEKEGLTEDEVKDKYYGLTDPYELLSEGLVNSKLMSALASLDETETTTWRDGGILKDFLKWVKSILDKSDEYSILDELMSVASDIIEANETITDVSDAYFGVPLYSAPMDTEYDDKVEDASFIFRTSDGRVITSPEKETAIGVIITAFAESVVEKDLKDASVASVFNQAKEDLIDRAKLINEYLQRDDLTEAQRTKLAADLGGIKKILDAKAWNSIRIEALRRLEAMGIRITGPARDFEPNDEEIHQEENDENTEDSDDRILSSDDGVMSEDWANEAQFSMKETDTSTKAVKLMMWSLRDPGVKALGIMVVMDPSESYRKVLTLLSNIGDTSIDGMLKAIREESELYTDETPNNIYQQLYDKLVDAPFEIQAQFNVAMKMHRNQFLVTRWSRDMNELITFESNRKNADDVVGAEWVSAMALSSKNDVDQIQSNVNKLREHIATAEALVNESVNNREISQDTDKRNAKRKEAMKHVVLGLEAIGITLSPATRTALLKDKSYNSKKNKFKSKTLRDQFTVSGTGNGLGIFSGLVQDAMTAANREGTTVDTIMSAIMSSSSIGFLKDIEAKTATKYFPNCSIGVDGNKHYNFGINSKQTSIFRKLLNDFDFVTRLKGSVFTRHASWLKADALGTKERNAFKNEASMEFIDGITMSGSKKVATRRKMTLPESILASLSNFQNSGRKASYIWGSAKSDKPTTTAFKTVNKPLPVDVIALEPLAPGMKELDRKWTVSQEKLMGLPILDDAASIVYGEMDRIYSLITMTSEQRDKTRKTHGESFFENGQYIYSYKFLNSLFTYKRNEVTGLPEVDGTAIIDVPGLGKISTSLFLKIASSTSVKDFIGDPKVSENYVAYTELVKDVVRAELAAYYADKIENDVQSWISNGIVSLNKDGKLETIPVNGEYMRTRNIGGQSEGALFFNQGKEHVARYLALDMALHASVTLANEVMLISGDFAKIDTKKGRSVGDLVNAFMAQGASQHDAITTAMDRTMPEYMKRLASDIAPAVPVVGEAIKLPNGKVLPKVYYTVVVEDFKTDGREYAEGMGSGVDASKLNSDGTDALEEITYEHKLEILVRAGKLFPQEYVDMVAEYNKSGKVDHKKLEGLNYGVGKPLQTPTNFVAIDGQSTGTHYDHGYVKSAEMTMTKNLAETISPETEIVRQALVAAGVGRLTRRTAFKYGKKQVINLRHANGQLKTLDELTKEFNEAKRAMPWEDFGYQQDQHESDAEDLVTTSTQADATLLYGQDDTEFTLRGSKDKVSGKDLKERKDSVTVKMSKLGMSKMYRNMPLKGTGFNKKALYKYVKKIAAELGWNDADVSSLGKLLNEDIPLLFSPIASKIEAVLFSQFTKNGIKPKKNGHALVQFPHLKRKDSLQGWSADQLRNANGIVYTDGYNKEIGLKFSKSDNGNVTIAECVVPFKFWKQNAKLDVSQFMTDGLVDPSKLDPELLRIIGLRIPNQGSSSQIMFKIVGFLPESYGDVVLVPPAIVTQMGSDFDIDKLFTYWRNNIVLKNGSMVSIPARFIKYNANNDISIDYKALKSWINDKFEDAIRNRISLAREISGLVKVDASLQASLKDIQDQAGLDKSNRNPDATDIMFDTEITPEEIRKTAMKSLGLTEDDVYVPSINELEGKILQDAYFDIFEAVLSHPDVINQAKSPLDKDDLQIMASESRMKMSSGEFMDYKRQLEDYVSQSGSKSGVAIYSRLVTAFALMDGKKIRFTITLENGDVVENKFSKFRQHSAQGGKVLDLSVFDPTAVSYFDGTVKRTAMDNIVTQQTGAVDNASKQGLPTNNLNENTFNVSGALSALADSNGESLALDTNTRFLRQDGIIELVKIVSQSKSSTATRDESKAWDIEVAAEMAKEVIKKKFGIRDENVFKGELDKNLERSYSPEDLLELEQTEDKQTDEYVAKQIDMIDMFVELYNRSWELNDAASMVSITSKGLAPNYYENEQKIENSMKATGSENVTGASKLWSRNGSMRVNRTSTGYEVIVSDNSDKVSTSGNSVAVAVEAQNVVGATMGYDSELVRTAVSTIEYNKSTNTSKITKATVKGRKSIVKNFKSFLFSKIAYVFNSDIVKQVKDGILVKRLAEMKKDPTLAGNMYIQTLQAADNQQLLIFNARVADGVSANVVIEAFYNLYTSDNPAHVEFAKDMIRYELMMGASQTPHNAIKYIHPSILVKEGIFAQVSNMFHSITGKEIHEFTIKYFKNNPTEAKYTKELNSRLSPNKRSITVVVNPNNKNAAPKEVVGAITKDIQGNGDETMRVFENFVRVTIDKRNVVFMLNQSLTTQDTAVYDRLDAEGSAGYAKWPGLTFSFYAGKADVAPADIQILPTSVSPPQDKHSVENLKSILGDNPTLKSISSKLMQLGNMNMSWVGGVIQSMGDKVSNVPITYSAAPVNHNSSAQYDPNTKTITVFEGNFNGLVDAFGLEYALTTVLHEINHAIMVDAYTLGKSGDTTYKKVYEATNSIYNDAVEAIQELEVVGNVTGRVFKGIKYKDVLDKLNGLTIEQKKAKLSQIAREHFPNDGDFALRNEFIHSLYSFIHPLEFMGDLNARPEFQKFMSTVQVSDKTKKILETNQDKSIVRALLEAFAQLFSTLNKMYVRNGQGQETSLNTVLEANFVNLMTIAQVEAVKQLPTSSGVINIYSGTGENADLSNFAERPFKIGEYEYTSVEQAFQSEKIHYVNEVSMHNNNLYEEILGYDNDLNVHYIDGGKLRKLGSRFLNLDQQKWDRDASAIMKKFILESFRQNEVAKNRLLSTGDAVLTHTQDNSKWGKEFPKLLMEVRDELRNVTEESPFQDVPAPYTSGEKPLTVGEEEGPVSIGFSMPMSNQDEAGVNSVTFSDGTVIETGGIRLNDQQVDALRKMGEFIKNRSGNTFALKGYAGTGKTTILNVLTKYLTRVKPFTEIFNSSPTHRANSVMRQKGARNVMTLHSLFGLQPDKNLEEFDANDAKYVAQARAKLAGSSVLIIDESSMINDELYKFIVENASRLHVQVIFVGDPAQIKPVKQTKLSKAFSNTDQSVELTKVERTGDNPLLAESLSLRNKTNNGGFSNKTAVNQVGEGVVFAKSMSSFLEQADKLFRSVDFKANPLLVRIVAATNSAVDAFNKKIRQGMFGDAADNEYNIGEILMGYNNFNTNYATGEPTIYNGGDYVVTSAKATTRSIAGKTYNGFDLVIKNLVNQDIQAANVFVLSKNTSEADLSHLGKTYEDLRVEAMSKPKGSPAAAKAWIRLSEFASEFVPVSNISYQGRVKIPATIKYGYAHTIHKSQGGTYKYSFVDGNSIDSAFSQDPELKNQLKYVAITRAEKASVILTNDGDVMDVPDISGQQPVLHAAGVEDGYPKQPSDIKKQYGELAGATVNRIQHKKLYDAYHLLNPDGTIKLMDISNKVEYKKAKEFVDWLNNAFKGKSYGAKLGYSYNNELKRNEWRIYITEKPASEPTLFAPGVQNLTGKHEPGNLNTQVEYYTATSTKGLLADIVKFTEDADTKALAYALLNIPNIETYKLNVIQRDPATNDWRIPGNNNEALGTHNANAKLIKVVGHQSKTGFESVFLHEAVHAVTVNEYYRNPEFKEKIDKLYNYALKFKDYKTSLMVDGHVAKFGEMYGMRLSALEFMAEGLSNPQFIYELSKYYSPLQEKLKEKNLFQEFIEVISNFMKTKLVSKGKEPIVQNLAVNLQRVVANYANVSPTFGSTFFTDEAFELKDTVATYLRNSDKSVRFAFREAQVDGLFKAKCD